MGDGSMGRQRKHMQLLLSQVDSLIMARERFGVCGKGLVQKVQFRKELEARMYLQTVSEAIPNKRGSEREKGRSHLRRRRSLDSGE